MVELGARVSLEEPLEVRVHCGPGRRLLLRVAHGRYRLAAGEKSHPTFQPRDIFKCIHVV